jgi:riboflavin kinase / FMN adenylyltransferase
MLRVYHSAEEFARERTQPGVATLGTFDGIHLGHAAIFSRLNEKAATLSLPPVVITFDPHPRVLVTPDDPPRLLTTTAEKIDILQNQFDGTVVILAFNDQLRQMTAEQFARDILLTQFGIRALVVGHDHSFGHRRTGNIDKLREIGNREGFEVEVVGPITYEGEPISSSRIRRAVSAGQWSEARAMLGHAYPIRGKVIRGLGHGRKMGWPTANIDWTERKLLPPQGVYSCTAAVNGDMHRGMMFVGVNMLNPEKTVSVEANLFAFDRDIYDADMTVFPLDFVRPNTRFPSMTELSAQIGKDKELIIDLLKNVK